MVVVVVKSYYRACLGMKSDTKNRNSISVTIPSSLEVPADHQLTNHNPGDHNRRNSSLPFGESSREIEYKD